MARRRELSDADWALLEPLLPARKTPGRYFHGHRQVLNALLHRPHMGLPWPDLPERYGPWETVYSHDRRRCRLGPWDRIPATL